MSCKAAIPTDEYHGWECTITEGPCMFFLPNSKACAEEYGEGPDAVTEEQIELGEFIKKYIAKNSLIRLWKPIDEEKPCGNKEMLTDGSIMEWEVLESQDLTTIPVVFVTDIVSDSAAINIVIQTDYSREDVKKITNGLRTRKEAERNQQGGESTAE